jgi:hypothetical protein
LHLRLPRKEELVPKRTRRGQSRRPRRKIGTRLFVARTTHLRRGNNPQSPLVHRFELHLPPPPDLPPTLPRLDLDLVADGHKIFVNYNNHLNMSSFPSFLIYLATIIIPPLIDTLIHLPLR